MAIYKNRHSLWLKTMAMVVVCLFLVNDIMYAQPDLAKSTLSPQSRLKPFFEKHGLELQNIATIIMAASELKGLVIDKKVREGAIYTKIEALNKLFQNGEVEIEKKILSDVFKCSGKEYKYAVFHFKKEKKTFNILFFEDHTALTPAELAELGIQDTEKHHLDCPGLEGVWFVSSGVDETTSRGGAPTNPDDVRANSSATHSEIERFFGTLDPLGRTGSNVWEMRQKNTGKIYYLKIRQSNSFRVEWLHYLLSRRLGCNTPNITRIEPRLYENIAMIKDYADPYSKLETSLGILTSDVFGMTLEDLSQKEGSGLEEALVFCQLSLYVDIDFGIKNSLIRNIGGMNRLVLFDLLGYGHVWIGRDSGAPLNIEEAAPENFSRFWPRVIKNIEPQRLVHAIQQLNSITPEEITRMALNSGYLPDDIDIGKFLKRKEDCIEEIINGLKSIQDKEPKAVTILEAIAEYRRSGNVGGTMGRWKYTHTTLADDGMLTLHNATRIPRKDGVVEEEFLINGKNEPRDIILQTRELSKEEITKLASLKTELGISNTAFRVILRNDSTIKHRVYGIAANEQGFLREDIIEEGNRDQIKEALDHEARELSKAQHDNIRQEQYSGGLRKLITQLSNKDKKEGLVYLKNKQRVWKALDAETPVIDESSEWSIRLYFLGQGLHMYISMATSGFYSVSVSNMGGNHTYRGYRYNGENPGEDISIEDKTDRELLNSKTIALLKHLRKDKGISDFLRVVEINESEKERMAALKKKYAREVVSNDDNERVRILEELNALLDIDMEKWTAQQTDRVQQLVAALGYDPVYTAEKGHPDNWPSHPMDSNICNIKQGDVIYIQYGVMSGDNEEEVATETEGRLQEIPGFGGKPVVTMTDGREVNLNQVREIIVDEGRGGYYKVDREAGGMAPYYFLMGGHLQRDVLQGELPRGASVSKDGIFKGMVDWPGVNKNLPIKFVTKAKITKKDAWNRMTGEKVIVLETPGEQNNGVFMYKRANGKFGDHDMADINRIIQLGVDSEVAQLSTHQFRKGDRVAIQGENKYYYGVVESFYAQAFIGRRMVVKLDNPPNTEKPYVHIKFVHEGEAMLIGAKNNFTKTQIPSSFERLYETINTKFIVMNTDLLEEKDSNGAMMDFWERFKTVYDILFGSEKMFEREDFNIKALDSVFQSGIGMTLEEMVNGITGITPLEPNNPLFLIGSLLDESEKEDIKRAYNEICLGLGLFAGQAAANTGTIPWVVKEQDMSRVRMGKTPQSDFTITALLRYFDTNVYPTFADKVDLAHKIAGARERYTLQEELYRLYANRAKVENLSSGAREMAAEAYTEKLQDPDDIGAMRFVLGLDPETGIGGTMGRWKYANVTLANDGTLTLHNATRIPRKDGVVEEEFLINGVNSPRDIVLKTRKLTNAEKEKISTIEQESGVSIESRVVIRDESAIYNRIYGIATQGIPFIREDIIENGSQGQIKEALDHENRELTTQAHDNIRKEQYRGDLRPLITYLSEKDKVEKEAQKMHEGNLKYTPTDIPDKTIICQIITDSTVPVGQRDMIQNIGQHMAKPEKNYVERITRLKDDNPDNFMDNLKEIIARQEQLNPGCIIEYYVACARPNDVEAILKSEFGEKLKIKAIAFEPLEPGINAVQVEGIVLALRALRKGPDSLRAAYKFLTGKDMGIDVNDLVKMMKEALFKVPPAKIGIDRVSDLNRLIEKYIEAAA